MGLTDKGYIRRNFQEILDGKIQMAKELFGEDIDTSDQGPLGKYLRLNAYDQALVDEIIESVYYSRSPNTATGQSLDRLLVFGNITRNHATPAAYRVKISGDEDFRIKVGTLVGTDTGLTFHTTQAAVIGEEGFCIVEVNCTEAGTIGNVSPASINKLVNTEASVSTVEGLECTSLGVSEESDAELRERLKNAIAGAGSCNDNAIRASLLRVPTVKFAAVAANETDEVDADGRPPHSFECYVLGGEDYSQEIAEAIYDKRPVGIRTVGTTAVTVTNASGVDCTVRYSYAPEVKVVVSAKIKTSPTFPADGEARIFSAVSSYINGLGIGKSLVLSTMYGHIYSVTGVTEVTELTASTNGGSSFSAANVSVPVYGIAVCEDVKVEVVVG